MLRPAQSRPERPVAAGKSERIWEMKRITLIALLVAVAVMALPALAQAASPRQIYNDFAADGRLDGSYTTNQLHAYLQDAAVHQYGSQAVLSQLDGLVRQLLAAPNAPAVGAGPNPVAQPVAASVSAPGGRSQFPFTGFEVALALLAGTVLVGGGVAIRRTVS
jgi:hypothetical protein